MMMVNTLAKTIMISTMKTIHMVMTTVTATATMSLEFGMTKRSMSLVRLKKKHQESSAFAVRISKPKPITRMIRGRPIVVKTWVGSLMRIRAGRKTKRTVGIPYRYEPSAKARMQKTMNMSFSAVVRDIRSLLVSK